MRIVLFAFVLFAAACSSEETPVLAPEGESGQTRDTTTAVVDVAADTSITAFFGRFQAAVRTNDGDAVEAMVDFPIAGLGDADQDIFLYTYYPTLFTDGDFRNRLLAASPRALEAQDDGSYRFMAVVNGCEGEETDCESAAIYTFRRDAEGRWRIADIGLAG